jgi:hypothetical protein
MADMVGVIDRVSLDICSDGNDKRSVLNLERKRDAEFFCRHKNPASSIKKWRKAMLIAA